MHEKTWRKFKYISLSEISQSEKDKYCVIPFWKRQNYGDSEKISGFQEFGGGNVRE